MRFIFSWLSMPQHLLNLHHRKQCGVDFHPGCVSHRRLPWKRKRHSHASPGARGSSPSKHGKHSSHSKHHGHHRHHRDRRDHTDNTSKDEDDWLNPGRLSASVSAAGSCQQAGAAAAAAAGAGAMSIARRARDLLGVTEEEEEVRKLCKQEDCLHEPSTAHTRQT